MKTFLHHIKQYVILILFLVCGAQELDLIPGQDLFTGGVDWTQEGVDAVKSGTMTATTGGHFMEGGWAAVLLYDYFHGADFAEKSVDMRSPMTALTKENIDAFIRFSQSDWKQIDFTKWWCYTSNAMFLN